MQTTILPVTSAGSSVSGPQSLASASSPPATPAASESTSFFDKTRLSLIEAPTILVPLPSTRVFSKLWCVEAATVVSHGLLCATVEASGPELPADAATKTPASAAPSKANSVSSMTVSVSPEIEKLRTSAPSVTASSIAATMSLVTPDAVPSSCAQRTLYAAILAAGAIPETVPNFTPSVFTRSTMLPAAVLAVCVPWPLPSRVDA